jgi:hypothetical protein
VNSTGLVFAVGVGLAIVTATDVAAVGLSAQCTLTVS